LFPVRFNRGLTDIEGIDGIQVIIDSIMENNRPEPVVPLSLPIQIERNISRNTTD